MFQPVECRKRNYEQQSKVQFLHTKLWFVELCGALINHCPKAFYYLIKLNLEQSKILWTVTGFPGQLLDHLKYVFENMPLTWITESNSLANAKLKFSFAKTTILFTFCCEHDSSSTGFYKACGYFCCYCNSEAMDRVLHCCSRSFYGVLETFWYGHTR